MGAWNTRNAWKKSLLGAAMGACATALAGCGGGNGPQTPFSPHLDSSRADPVLNTKNVTVTINGVSVPVTRRGTSDSWKFVIARDKVNKNGPIAWKLPECTGTAKGDIAGVVQYYTSVKQAPRFQLMAG
jgi:hypothetical protein